MSVGAIARGGERPPPLRVLSVLASPVDLPRFDEARLWQEMKEAVQAYSANGSIVLERLEDPTEIALRRSLAQDRWHVLHLVVHAQERSAAHYGTITLQATDGHARSLTAGYLAGLVAASPSVKVVVLQAGDESTRGFDTVAGALLDQGVSAVVMTRTLRGRREQIFVSRLYSGLLAGLSPDGIQKRVASALAADAAEVDLVRCVSRDANAPVFASGTAQVLLPVTALETVPTDRDSASQIVEKRVSPSGWQHELKRKRSAGEFDVFLCHNSADKDAVKRIGQKLKEAGILPWLDDWELPPGQPWQQLLERQIGNIRSAAVFVGSARIGPWQEQELNAFLREFVARNVPVIPVLLADAPSTPDLPIFLRAMTWVDFRVVDRDPLELLIWGITGKRPDE